VLHQACMQLRDWARQGVQVGHLSVNLSARQFRQKGLAGLLSRVLRDTGIEPDALDLELTESMLMDDIESAVRTMKILKEMGMHLSLDDFGTGYSSLSHLKRFPIDTLKIDQSFVSEIPDDPRSAAVVDGIIALGHRLTLSVLAEGVETREQLNLLRQSGCDVVQGYLFCHPVPAEQLTTLLRDSRPQFPLCSDHSAPAAR
jgi:EAL domain-containing protein (putative c-di-GMP-specific phosphodiesterase class I)